MGLFSTGLTLYGTTKLKVDQSKLKAFADDKINVTEKVKFVVESVENVAGKEENAGYQHFLLFPQFFPKFLSRVIKGRDCVVKG